MLPRQHRLTRGGDFRRIFRHGTRVNHTAGLFVAVPAESSQFGFVVSKGVGNAVERNRAKRKLRAAAQSVLGHPDTAAVVVRASSGVHDTPVAELADLLGEVMSKAQKR